MRDYTLTLTNFERCAIDWIGHRYAHGDDLYRLLWGNCEQTPADADWDDLREITFTLRPESAHRLTEIRDEENGHWPCFAPELAGKLDELCHDYETDFPNLDCMDVAELEAYKNDRTHHDGLALYAATKLMAIRARLRGDMDRAAKWEEDCNLYFSSLPKWAKW